MTAAPEQPVRQRVGDVELCAYNAAHALAIEKHATFETRAARDLKDARTALAERDATIWELREETETWRKAYEGLSAHSKHWEDRATRAEVDLARLSQPDEAMVEARTPHFDCPQCSNIDACGFCEGHDKPGCREAAAVALYAEPGASKKETQR